MKHIEKRKDYQNGEFDEMLENSNELVDETVKILENTIDMEKYKIISNFDNTLQGVIDYKNFYKKNLTKENLELFLKFSKKRFKTKEELKKYITKEQILIDGIKYGLRAHDIAIIEKATNNIVALFECKDFPQLVYYPETGLPIFYIEKLTLLKNILENNQNSTIQQFFVFQDNKELEKNRKNKNINLPIIIEPYFIELKDENINELKIKKNKDGSIIPTYFLNEIKNKIPQEALNQHTWKISEMNLLKKFNNKQIKGYEHENRNQITRSC